MSVLHFRIGLYIRVKLFRTLKRLGIVADEQVLDANEDYMDKYSSGTEL